MEDEKYYCGPAFVYCWPMLDWVLEGSWIEEMEDDESEDEEEEEDDDEEEEEEQGEQEKGEEEEEMDATTRALQVQKLISALLNIN